MSYYSALGLSAEPFSTSPDPSFLFFSREHKAAFFRMQVAITLRRGLCVLLGDVGTGKTTLSRKLSRALKADPNVVFHMILNPYFKSDEQFLGRLARLLRAEPSGNGSGLDVMEAVEQSLFRLGVEQGKTVVLLIDEAQILPDFVLEILRILLNYETNEYKILQLVLVGQMELLPRIRAMKNFWDRIALKYILHPLNEREVRDLIEFRLRQAGYRGREPLFTDEAVRLVWEHTKGYPRRLALICHNALECLVMYDKRTVEADTMRRVIEAETRAQELVAG